MLCFQSSTKTSEVEVGDDQDGKDDDDDNDDDDDEKIPVGKEIDPERLKAFNVSEFKSSIAFNNIIILTLYIYIGPILHFDHSCVCTGDEFIKL